MICSICQTQGHNRRTCSVVVRYEYDDCGVKCRINPNDEGDYQPVEPYCLPCGSPTEECECGEYKCGKWFNEEKGKFQGAPRRSSPRRPSCADFDVDDRDAPNVRPYKKCSVCGDRKSCGSYKENDWFCEDCYEEEEEEEECVDDNDRSYGPRGPPAPESDDDDDDDMSECDCCGEMFELGTFNIAEDAECNQEAYCDECWKLKIEDGCVWQDENGEWVC